MTHFLDEWLIRKRGRPLLSIREARTSRFKYTRQLGARGHFAVVQLRGEPASDFAFRSRVNWLVRGADYSTAVLDGILDELFASNLGHVVAKVHFTLEAIEWHEVDSCAVAFYHAARGAVREILGLDTYKDHNVELPYPRRD
ncbi:MAG: hypothetical protein HYX68_29570 [Planctomycetes bacterium]|jgi:hypothetical protein|nr:hypothetical protein [Planctomycetota bacterium]